jgi:hypothetical protein
LIVYIKVDKIKHLHSNKREQSFDKKWSQWKFLFLKHLNCRYKIRDVYTLIFYTTFDIVLIIKAKI